MKFKGFRVALTDLKDKILLRILQNIIAQGNELKQDIAKLEKDINKKNEFFETLKCNKLQIGDILLTPEQIKLKTKNQIVLTSENQGSLSVGDLFADEINTNKITVGNTIITDDSISLGGEDKYKWIYVGKEMNGNDVWLFVVKEETALEVRYQESADFIGYFYENGKKLFRVILAAAGGGYLEIFNYSNNIKIVSDYMLRKAEIQYGYGGVDEIAFIIFRPSIYVFVGGKYRDTPFDSMPVPTTPLFTIENKTRVIRSIFKNDESLAAEVSDELSVGESLVIDWEGSESFTTSDYLCVPIITNNNGIYRMDTFVKTSVSLWWKTGNASGYFVEYYDYNSSLLRISTTSPRIFESGLTFTTIDMIFHDNYQLKLKGDRNTHVQFYVTQITFPSTPQYLKIYPEINTTLYKCYIKITRVA